MIYYYCPDIQISSAGIRRLYRHVSILSGNGIPASILHTQPGFAVEDMPDVAIAYIKPSLSVKRSDVVVIPESYPHITHMMKDLPIRRFVIALNWSYVFRALPDKLDWRALNIERVLAVSPFIADRLGWVMGLPTHLLASAIAPSLYFNDPQAKQKKVVYIARKAGKTATYLKRALRARNQQFTTGIEWQGVDGLSQEEYASCVRSASVFLNLSPAEGLVTSCLEAMQSGTIVAGFSSMGGQGTLIGEGQGQNCVLAETGDYLTLAHRMEPLLLDLLANNMRDWQGVIRAGLLTTEAFTPEAEEQSLIEFWSKFAT